MYKSLVLLLVSLFCCYVNADEAPEVLFETLIKTSKSWDGKDLPKYSDGTPEITILKVVVPPGAVVQKHEHPVINAAVIVAGEITVVSELEDEVVLRAGDSVVELVNTVHYGTNTGSTNAELLVFYAGVKGKPLSIKK
ncbi:cupin domain-containing protein [Ketobacter alkanivorans]|uniref:Cupin type-2 domain-containing protein n=1 Tax=Ketobacter alkanivorans TaxID=1917421 RepID=A0A2K9LQV3_9GAMM|nr:cupin domain-containing protein [Ketobacter alkanivorans]AUM14716.1 hypothetical protein Kalk_20790 [Ketobacter alkanivorans]